MRRSVLVLWMIIVIITNHHTICGPTGFGFTGYPTFQGFIPPVPQGLANTITQNQINSARTQQFQQIVKANRVDSYAPPASGTDSLPPKTEVIQSLPPLLPSSVIKQLMKTFSATSPNAITPTTSDFSPLPPIPTFEPLRDQPLISYNSLENNATLYAAGVLSSILHSGITSFPTKTTLTEIDSGEIDEQSLNKTNVIIIKSEKRAYLVPQKLSETLDHNAVQGLYNQKDKLENVYTVNQFLFIVKPRNVNFLNKLV